MSNHIFSKTNMLQVNCILEINAWTSYMGKVALKTFVYKQMEKYFHFVILINLHK